MARTGGNSRRCAVRSKGERDKARRRSIQKEAAIIAQHQRLHAVYKREVDRVIGVLGRHHHIGVDAHLNQLKGGPEQQVIALRRRSRHAALHLHGRSIIANAIVDNQQVLCPLDPQRQTREVGERTRAHRPRYRPGRGENLGQYLWRVECRSAVHYDRGITKVCTARRL